MTKRLVRTPDHADAYMSIWFGPIGGLIPRTDYVTVVNKSEWTLTEFVYLPNVTEGEFDIDASWSAQTYVIPSWLKGRGLDANATPSVIFGKFLDRYDSREDSDWLVTEELVSDDYVTNEYLCYIVVPPRFDTESM